MEQKSIFKYENWPYFFMVILAILIIYNAYNCYQSGRYLIYTPPEKKTMQVVPVDSIKQVTEKTAAQVASQIAAETTTNVLTETFSSPKRKRVIIKKGKKTPENFKSVRRVAQRENFGPIDYANRKMTGVDIGAAGCNGEGCVDCHKNLNDQINLGVNNYIFPNCNGDYMCANGCNIQDQINNYQFDYYMGHSCTELERSRSGQYTSLNVDSCSQDCPSMGWMPAAVQSRTAADEYIQTLVPVDDLKKK